MVDEGAEAGGGLVPGPVALYPGAALFAHGPGRLGVGEQGDEAVRQGRHVPAADHVAGLALEDRVGGAAGVAADDREAGRRGLEVDDAQALDVEAAAPGAAGHREDVARGVMGREFRLRDRAGEVDGGSQSGPFGQLLEVFAVRARADDEQRGVRDLPDDLRPGAQERVLALAADQSGDADHHPAIGQAVPLPDRLPGGGVGPEGGRVDAGVELGQPRRRGRGERPGQPDPEVLAQVGDDVGSLADTAQQAPGDRQGRPAGLVAVGDRDGLPHPGAAQRGGDQAERRGGAEDDDLGLARPRQLGRAVGDAGAADHQRRRVPTTSNGWLASNSGAPSHFGA